MRFKKKAFIFGLVLILLLMFSIGVLAEGTVQDESILKQGNSIYKLSIIIAACISLVFSVVNDSILEGIKCFCLLGIICSSTGILLIANVFL